MLVKDAHNLNPARSHLEFIPILSGLSYEQARGLEQALMLLCHTLNTADDAANQINGISTANPNLWTYINAAATVFGSVFEYGYNWITDEILSSWGV